MLCASTHKPHFGSFCWICTTKSHLFHQQEWPSSNGLFAHLISKKYVCFVFFRWAKQTNSISNRKSHFSLTFGIWSMCGVWAKWKIKEIAIRIWCRKPKKKRRKKRNYEDCHSHKKINLPWTMHTNNNNVEHIAHTFFLAVLLFNLSLVLCIFVVVLLLLPLLLLVGIYLFGFGWCRFAFTFMPINQYCFA